jgi:hypothetical protein
LSYRYYIKILIKKIFFNKVESKDFNSLFSYTLELLPNETLLNVIKLLINIFMSKPSDLFSFPIIKEVINHTIPSNNRIGIAERAKIIFILIIISNLTKRIILIIKKWILLPFKLGVYSFIAYLFGIKMDWLLSLFDIFKFNLPSWTYSKLLDLHISWLNWIKNTLQINSITTDEEKPSYFPIPKLKKSSYIINSEIESKPDTILYLTKKEWLYATVSLLFIMGAYLVILEEYPTLLVKCLNEVQIIDMIMIQIIIAATMLVGDLKGKDI